MKRGSRGLHLDYVALHQRYVAGESGVEIARSVGIDHTGLYMAWKRRGLPMRSGSEAKRLEFQRYPERRTAAPMAMQAARRGNTDPMERRIRRALTREERQLGTSRLEDEVAAYFDQNGVEYVRQKAIGPYNVDFAIPAAGVVIEINGGGHNPRVRANRARRTAYIESEGWEVVDVTLTRGVAGGVAIENESRLITALRHALRNRPRPLVL